MSDATESLSPYPWNPWVEVGNTLRCQFCASAESQTMSHKDHCAWLRKMMAVHPANNTTRQLLQETGPG